LANPKETLLDWLRDAHAMEDSIVSLLEKQAGQLDDKPSMQSKIREHLEITRDQRDRLKALIGRLGGDVSFAKKITGSFLANLQALTLAGAPDAVVKNVLTDFAVEHFEIACYTSLIAAAEMQGQSEVVRVCRQILDEEREMAAWLEHQIPRVTTEYLGKEAIAKK